MIGTFKLIVDSFCELAPNLESITDDTFYDFQKHTLVPGAIYVFSRQQFLENVSEIKQLAQERTILVIFANPAEGADTMYWQCKNLDIFDLVRQQKILLISGGKISDHVPCLLYEHLLVQVHNYESNLQAIEQYNAEEFFDRPYKFLFLNGRMRSHRKYLLEKFRTSGLLEQSLWTNLDPRTCKGFRYLDWYVDEDYAKFQHIPNQEFVLDPFPVQKLPAKYETQRFRTQSDITANESTADMYVKKHLFNNEWGEIYLEAQPYIDTYFSLVTETTFDYMYSFRTEKIAKPLAIGHPWIAAANAGFYQDLKNLGFKTFDSLINESFDLIDNPTDRCARISEVVEDLCQQDLNSFISASRHVCLHNKQHLRELHLELQDQFLPRFIDYAKQNFQL